MIVARSATLRYPRPVPIGVSTGLADFATGTLGARVSNGPAVYALSNNHVFAGVNMASIGDPILQPGPIEDGGIDPDDRIGTLADYQEIDFSGSPNTMDAAIALTTTGDVGTATLPDGYGSPSSTTVPASVGLQVQKYGRTTGFTTGLDQRGQRRRRRLLLPAERDDLLPRFRGPLRQPVLRPRRGRPLQRVRRFGLAPRRPRLEPAGRAAVRRWRRADDREPDRPRPAALQRHDRRHAGRARPARRPHRSRRGRR